MNQVGTTTEVIHQWVLEQFPAARKQSVGVHDSLLDTGIIDSLGTLEVVQFLEERFGIEVTDDEMVADYFDSVVAMAELVATKKSPTRGESKA